MTTCTRPRRPRLATRLPQLEIAAELTRIELGYRAAIAHRIGHLTCDKQRPYPVRARTNYRQVQQWTRDLAARLARHAAGDGARLLEVVHQAGITWQLARVWPGTQERERQLKRQGGASRRCPLCKRTRRAEAPCGSGPLFEDYEKGERDD